MSFEDQISRTKVKKCFFFFFLSFRFVYKISSLFVPYILLNFTQIHTYSIHIIQTPTTTRKHMQTHKYILSFFFLQQVNGSLLWWQRWYFSEFDVHCFRFSFLIWLTYRDRSIFTIKKQIILSFFVLLFVISFYWIYLCIM